MNEYQELEDWLAGKIAGPVPFPSDVADAIADFRARLAEAEARAERAEALVRTREAERDAAVKLLEALGPIMEAQVVELDTLRRQLAEKRLGRDNTPDDDRPGGFDGPTGAD